MERCESYRPPSPRGLDPVVEVSADRCCGGGLRGCAPQAEAALIARCRLMHPTHALRACGAHAGGVLSRLRMPFTAVIEEMRQRKAHPRW